MCFPCLSFRVEESFLIKVVEVLIERPSGCICRQLAPREADRSEAAPSESTSAPPEVELWGQGHGVSIDGHTNAHSNYLRSDSSHCFYMCCFDVL